MNPTYTTPKSIAVLVLVLLFVVTGIAAADEELSGLSGKVVDLEGNAVAGFTFAIQPVQLHDGFLEPERGFQPLYPREKLIRGAFTVSDIQPGLVQLIALPEIRTGCV